ncbi:MAG TPA: hypothetical protein PKD10_02190 [Paracoccaceae bacterium]|nr:hypothetical protein [Paracoccaceae bacterium]HMO73018.1 hypothetical protein [Paracoccaceae bacterium]
MGPQRILHARRGWLVEPTWDSERGAFAERLHPLVDLAQTERAAMAVEALFGPMADGGPLSDRLAFLEASNPRALDLPPPDTAGGLRRLKDWVLTRWARWLARPFRKGRESALGASAAGNHPHL